MFDLSERLRQRGWLVPAYTFPADLQDMAVLRIVVRNGFSMDLADAFLADLRRRSRSWRRIPARRCRCCPEGVRRGGFAH